jgi:very-short-patch-repair endonuclease
VVDFCNTKTRTIIEIDGSIHSRIDVIENDRLRQKELEGIGYKFLRFSNEEIYENIEKVLKRILDHMTVPSCQGGDSSP